MQESLNESVGEVPKLRYDALVNTSHDFRLLTIKAREDSQIYGELTNVSHRSCPRYYALSYEWGNSVSKQPIIVKSCAIEFAVSVTLNLHLAIQHLVRELEDLVIWIDAICINQSDDEERAQQVLIMRDIYAQAEETFVWLGPSITVNMLPDDSVVDLINMVGPDASESGLFELMTNLTRYSFTNQELYEKTRAEINDLFAERFKRWERFAKLLGKGYVRIRKLSYWNRIWIVQEIATSKKFSFQWGRHRIQSEHLRGFFAAFQMFGSYLTSLSLEILQKNELPDDEIRACMLDHSQPHSTMHTAIFGIRGRYHALGQLPQEPLLNLLARTSIPNPGTNIRSSCKEPQDRIFGLLGLSSDRETLAIPVTYKKPFRITYEETARAIIAGGTLDLLAYSQFPKSDPQMPTWVPDWQMQFQSLPLVGEDKKNDNQCHNHWRNHIHTPYGGNPWDTAFRASGIRNFKPSANLVFENASFSPLDSPPLVLRGVRIDKIVSFKNPWAFDIAGSYAGNLDRIPSYLNDIESLIEESNAKGTNIYQNPSDRMTAYYRIPIADLEMNLNGFCHQATESSCVGYHLIKIDLEEGNIFGSEVSIEKINYWNVMETLHYRRPFITENGYVGLGPKHLEKDDIVVVFLGARFPYILRKSLQVGWTLVGEAYVHGIMYGESMEEEKREESFSLY